MYAIFKDKNLVFAIKPQGMPSQQDPSGDLDLMSALSSELSFAGENSKLWLVHRLDRTVGGLMVFARNQRTAAELSALIQDLKLTKIYEAVVKGDCPEGELFDYIYKDAAKGKAFIAKGERKGVKAASLTVTPLSKAEGKYTSLSLCRVKLNTGRFHQIRVQLSSRGNPIVGDKKYGGSDRDSDFPALYCTRLGFEYNGKLYDFSVKPPKDKYPWNLFSEFYGGEDK